MIGESILELHETNATDESIKSYEYNEYQPINGTQLNSAGQITITIENQDQFLNLHNSYLLIEGEVLKADNTRYAVADLIALTNNGLLYLFSSLKLTLVDKRWNMSIIQVMLHHFFVWRAIHRNIKRDVDWHKVGMQIPALLQLLLILDLVSITVSDTITRSKK